NVVLLIDENEQPAHDQQYGHDEQHRSDDGAHDVSIQDGHERSLNRKFARMRGPEMNAKASNTIAACVHHNPRNSGIVPRASQTLPAETRLEYAKYTTIASHTRE